MRTKTASVVNPHSFDDLREAAADWSWFSHLLWQRMLAYTAVPPRFGHEAVIRQMEYSARAVAPVLVMRSDNLGRQFGSSRSLQSPVQPTAGPWRPSALPVQ